jgi:hypothetical protein
MKLVECPSIPPHDLVHLLKSLLSNKCLPEPLHTTTDAFVTSCGFHIYCACLQYPANGLVFSRLLSGRKDFLAPLAAELQSRITEAERVSQNLKRFFATEAPPTSLEHCGKHTVLEEMILLRGDFLRMYKTEHNTWRNLLEDQIATFFKRSSPEQWYGFCEWVRRDTTLSLTTEDRNQVVVTIASIAKRMSEKAKLGYPRNEPRSFAAILKRYHEARDESKDATDAIDWLCNFRLPDEKGFPDPDLFPYYPMYTQLHNDVKKMLKAERNQTLISQHLDNLCVQNPWIDDIVRSEAPCASAATSVSTRERKKCPECSSTSQIMQACVTCSRWMHSECLKKHKCPHAASGRNAPAKTRHTELSNPEDHRNPAPAPPAATEVPPRPARVRQIQRLAAEKPSADIYGEVGTDKKPYERATDQETTASLDHLDVPTINKFKVKADENAWVDLVHWKIQHFGTAPMPEKQAIIWELLNLPKYFCRKFNVAGASQRSRRSFQSQQLQGYVMTARPPVQAKSSAESRRMKKVSQLIQDGQRGKAARTAMQENCDFADVNDALADLRKLHPPEAESPDLCLKTTAKFHDLDPNLVEKTVKQMCHGSAAGRTGWTEELLRPLLTSEKTRREITSIFTMIINDEVAPEIRDRINAARLIAVPKPPKNAHEKPGTRPITVNETFRKVAQAIVVKSTSSIAAKHFEGLQYGISVEGGAEILCHRISKGIKEKRILVALDAKNAFNTPWRRAIAAELQRNPQFHAIINQWNFCYSRHTDLHYRHGGIDTIIKSQRGTRQGDVLGAFLFALVIHPVLVEAKEKFGSEVDIVAYLDDITLLGNNSNSMKACVQLIEERFRCLGIELNPSKCEWFSEKATCPFVNWKQVRDDPIKILGAFHAPEGKEWERRAEECILNHTIAKHSLFFERLQKLPSNVAIVLLSACGIPRMNYTMRVQDPKVAKKACEHFDGKVLETFESISCTKLDEESYTLISLPTALGGCGLTRTAEIGPLAYAASKSLIGPKDDRKSQDELTMVFHVDQAKRLQQTSPQMKLHMEDCASEGSAAWIQSAENVELMKDETVAAALRLRANAPIDGSYSKESFGCPGCGRMLHPKEMNQHLSGCARVKGRNAAGRHAYFKNSIGRMCTANGIHHQHKEPQGYEMRVCTICRETFPESKSIAHIDACEGASIHHIKEAASVRPDKWMELRGEKGTSLIEVVIDVSIVAGTTATNINDQSSIDDGLRERERRKKVLYGEAAKERGEKLMVIAVTPNGTLSADSKELSKMIARTSDSKGAYTARHAERDLRRAVLTGSAISLINAEKAAKIYYSPKTAREVEEIMAAAQPASDTAPEWYELPEEAPMLAAGKVGSARNPHPVPSEEPDVFHSCPSSRQESPAEEYLPDPCPTVSFTSPSYPPQDHALPYSVSNPPHLQNPVSCTLPPYPVERLSSYPAHLASAANAPHAAPFLADPSCDLNQKDSQNSYRMSFLHGVVLGPKPSQK